MDDITEYSNLLHELSKTLGIIQFDKYLSSLSTSKYDKWKSNVKDTLYKIKTSSSSSNAVHEESSKEALQVFKKKMKEDFNTLRDKENQLNQEINQVLKKIDFIQVKPVVKENGGGLELGGDVVGVTGENVLLLEDRQMLNELETEVGKIDSRLNGGDLDMKYHSVMSKEEHEIFIKAMDKRSLVEVFPHYSTVLLQEHIDWYNKVKVLQGKKKELLKEWRLCKNRIVIAEEEQKKAVEVGLEVRKKAEVPAIELKKRFEKKLMVEQWKMEKKLKEEFEVKESELKMKERKLKEREMLANKQQRNKEVIEKVHLEKLRVQKELVVVQMENEKILKREREEQRAILSARVTEREKKMEESRKAALQMKTAAIEKRDLNRAMLTQKIKTEIDEKVEPKLYDTPIVVRKDEDLEIVKQLDRFGKKPIDTFGGNLVRVSGRAVPQWRQATTSDE
jgi:hypothetical protein